MTARSESAKMVIVNLLTRIAINGLAIWVAAFLIDGISVTGPDGDGSWVKTIITLAVVGAIFGVMNALVRPILKFITMPLMLLTLGLFTFILNALMLQLTSWVTSFTPITFGIESFFWDAVLGAILISIVSFAANLVLPDKD